MEENRRVKKTGYNIECLTLPQQGCGFTFTLSTKTSILPENDHVFPVVSVRNRVLSSEKYFFVIVNELSFKINQQCEA